jgi:hypothetical protein
MMKNPVVESILHLRTVNQEQFENNKNSDEKQLSSNYNNDLYIRDVILQHVENKITSNRQSIDELEESTQGMHRVMYAIGVGVIVLILIGILTGVKGVVGLKDKSYMILVLFLLFSYLLYLFYLFNWMYVRDGIQKIKLVGQVDIDSALLNPLPKQLYVEDLCRKKRAQMNPKVVSSTKNENEEEESSKFVSSSSFRKSLPDNKNVYFYNDGDAPKLLQYPTKVPKTNYGMIYYPDQNGNRKKVERTYQL